MKPIDQARKRLLAKIRQLTGYADVKIPRQTMERYQVYWGLPMVDSKYWREMLAEYEEAIRADERAKIELPDPVVRDLVEVGGDLRLP